MEVYVVPVSYADRGEDLRAIRHTVFVEEQSVPPEEEWDDLDAESAHFLALTDSGVPVGCARLQPNGKVTRMAVLQPFRQFGVGAELLDAVTTYAVQAGHTQLFLHAQRQAEGFYRRNGFLPQGDTFDEAGIAHIRMERNLPLTYQPPTVAAQPATEARDGEDDRGAEPAAESTRTSAESFEGEAAARARLQALLNDAQRSAWIYTPNIDPVLFDDGDLVRILSEFCRAAARNRLRILFHDSSLAVTRGHRLIQLQQRLTAHIQCRKVPGEYATDRHCAAVVDDRGYWSMPEPAEYQGLCNLHDPVRALRLVERFEYLWERSTDDPELRLLRL